MLGRGWALPRREVGTWAGNPKEEEGTWTEREPGRKARIRALDKTRRKRT